MFEKFHQWFVLKSPLTKRRIILLAKQITGVSNGDANLDLQSNIDGAIEAGEWAVAVMFLRTAIGELDQFDKPSLSVNEREILNELEELEKLFSDDIARLNGLRS